jgi:hypothetical protein
MPFPAIGGSLCHQRFHRRGAGAGRCHDDSRHNLLEPQEVHGRYYNVDRLAPTDSSTAGSQPAEDQRPTVTVLFIGGSNVYGAKLPTT